MVRAGIQPQNCLPTMQLPSTRNVSLRQRTVPSRGGQLQIAGVVVGSWGANYGFQNHRPTISTYTGRGRPLAPGCHFNQQLLNRDRQNQHQQRKPGNPSYPVAKKSANKRNATNKSIKNSNHRAQGAHTLTVKTECGDIPADEIMLKKAVIETGNLKGSILKYSSEQHKDRDEAVSGVETAKLH